MVERMFINVLNMSLTASYVILFVLVARLLLKKAPKIFSYALWGVVLIRLLCTFSFESVVSLIPVNRTPIPHDIIYSQVPQISTGVTVVDNMINPALPAPIDVGASINPIQVWIFIGVIIWILGIIAMAVYSMISFIKLKGSLITSTPLKDNIYLADHITTPFVLGVIKPNIYIPSSLLENEQNYIIRHEQCHIKRLDHITRILGFIAVAIHWFNPLVWIAFVLSGKDMELSCDEAVMKSMDSDIKAEYSQSLLRFSTSKKLIHATPLAFGEGDTKNRVKNVLSYKKPKFWVVLITTLLCVISVFCLVSNPTGTTIQNPYVQEYLVGTKGILGVIDADEYTAISEDFAIGADKYGRAVFKDPNKAFTTFETLYADAIELIKSENDLKRFSHKNYKMYKVYGWQMGDKEGNIEILARCVFVSSFLDIYENSFDKTVPNSSYVEPTLEVKDIEPFIIKVENGTKTATLKNEDLAKEIVINSLAISAAWEGVDIDTLDDYYHIHYLIAEDSTMKDYYAYLLDGKPVLQYGKDGQYIRLNDELYDKLESSFKPLTTDQAVIKALSTTSNRYLEGECFGEGHIILGTEKDDDSIKVYTLTMVGYYGFVNNNFEKVSGSGIIPAVVTLKNNNNVEIEYPEDGSYYTTSIKKMFPEKYHDRILKQRDEDRNDLTKQEQAYAKEYLSKIGRKAEIGDYRDFEHTILTSLGVSVEVSNRLEYFYKAHSYYPYFIGTKEMIEDGVRMVYEMSYQESLQEIRFTKYLYDSKQFVEQFVFNSLSGEEIVQ